MDFQPIYYGNEGEPTEKKIVKKKRKTRKPQTERPKSPSHIITF